MPTGKRAPVLRLSVCKRTRPFSKFLTPSQRNPHMLWMFLTEGFTVSSDNEHSSQGHVPGPNEPTIPELEVDETIAPRPEEEIADVARAKPDVEDHSQHPE